MGLVEFVPLALSLLECFRLLVHAAVLVVILYPQQVELPLHKLYRNDPDADTRGMAVVAENDPNAGRGKGDG